MFQAVATIVKECWKNRRRMFAIAVYNLSLQYSQTKLKLLWTILNPVIQAATYWTAYHIGMKVQSPIDDVPYLAWMLTGLIPWFFISAVLTIGTVSVINARGIIKNMSYPIATIPFGTVCTEFLTFLCSFAVLVVIQLSSGIVLTWKVLWVLYFMICSFVLLLGYTYLASTLNVFFRDLQKFIQAGVRLLFFLSPVCWSASSRSGMEAIMRWNPFAYLLEGYRGAMLHQGQFNILPSQHVYFWVLSLVLLFVGCWLHTGLREQFSDYL